MDERGNQPHERVGTSARFPYFAWLGVCVLLPVHRRDTVYATQVSGRKMHPRVDDADVHGNGPRPYVTHRQAEERSNGKLGVTYGA